MSAVAALGANRRVLLKRSVQFAGLAVGIAIALSLLGHLHASSYAGDSAGVSEELWAGREQASGQARCRIEGEFGFARPFHEVERACGLAPASDLDLEGKGKDCHRKRPTRQFRRWRGLEPRAAAFVVTGRWCRGDRHDPSVLEHEVGTLEPGGVMLG